MAEEKLIRTPSIDEALAYIEAFLFGTRPLKLWIVGEQGCGKTFLADWARQQTKNGKRGSIFDARQPDLALPFWLAFTRHQPDDQAGGEVIFVGAPEYERKAGIMTEWAISRGLSWDPQALATLLKLETNNLQTLRSLADRTARESTTPNPTICEVDVLRTLARLGYLDKLREQIVLPVGASLH